MNRRQLIKAAVAVPLAVAIPWNREKPVTPRRQLYVRVFDGRVMIYDPKHGVRIVQTYDPQRAIEDYWTGLDGTF